MVTWNDVIRELLKLGIVQLAKLIPWLGGFLAGPFGFILSPIIGYLTGLMYDWIERLARFKKIEAEVQNDLLKVKETQSILKEAQTNVEKTPEEKAKAIADFTAAVSKLGRIRV